MAPILPDGIPASPTSPEAMLIHWKIFELMYRKVHSNPFYRVSALIGLSSFLAAADKFVNHVDCESQRCTLKNGFRFPNSSLGCICFFFKHCDINSD